MTHPVVSTACGSTPLNLQSRSGAPIHSLALSHEATDALSTVATSVWTAHGDGVCCNWRSVATANNTTTTTVSTELSGPHFDPVRGLAVAPHTGRVFTVGRDGLLRDYNPHVVS